MYHNLLPINFVMACVFCYVWVFVSNNVITPVFLAISEDGFLEQRRKSKFSWLSDRTDLKDPCESELFKDELAEN